MAKLDSKAFEAAQQAIGRGVTREQRLDGESVRRFALAIGDDGEGALPVLAHWAWFLPDASDSEIGDDGHPRRGAFLPDIEALPRRMFAASALRFAAPLELEKLAKLRSTITGVRHVEGRSGDLVFVDVERVLIQDDVSRVSETQTIVYRDAGDGKVEPLPEPATASDAGSGEGEVWTPAPVHLFRFSAATFNAHRIHYDRDYARDVEGYPELIVHGPFIASKLAELAAQDGRLSEFSFRAKMPCFANQPIRLTAAGPGEYHALRCDGTIAMTAKTAFL